VLECVVNVSEGRRTVVLTALVDACGASLLDVHADADHHRSVLTLAGDRVRGAVEALCVVARDHIDIRSHEGVHPRLGAVDVVPFVALAGATSADAVGAAHDFGAWAGQTLEVPVFFYGAADEQHRSLPSLRADAFRERAPDAGPSAPHLTFGAMAVGARPPLVAINCELATDDVVAARAIASIVRERDGGLAGVRALGLPLASRRRAQVSMNLVDLDATGVDTACFAVRAAARARGTDVVAVELVGLIPAGVLDACSDEFRAWTGITEDDTIERRLAAAGFGP
jgi:glutamate formiminotransferase